MNIYQRQDRALDRLNENIIAYSDLYKKDNRMKRYSLSLLIWWALVDQRREPRTDAAYDAIRDAYKYGFIEGMRYQKNGSKKKGD